jgi:hypothetical protein
VATRNAKTSRARFDESGRIEGLQSGKSILSSSDYLTPRIFSFWA